MATSVEVFWPDGRSVARALEPSEINSVQEIHYPRDEEEVTPSVEIEVHKCFIVGFSMFFILNTKYSFCPNNKAATNTTPTSRNNRHQVVYCKLLG